jgi:hypothetical protein
MSLLSEEEIEKLKEFHPLKRIFRFLFLIIGISIIFIGFVLFVIGFDYGIIIDDINLSLLVDVLIIIFGMIIASKYFIAPYYLRENSLTIKKMRDLREPVNSYVKFNSVALTRFIAALLLIIAGIVSLLVFGMDVGHEVPYGSAVVLGGPSFFYVTGLPAIGIGFGLILYFFLSPFRGTFSQSKNFYFFYEVRPFCPWLTEIPKKDIEAIRYQNNHIGPKLGWIMLILPFIVMQLMTAISLFKVERAGPKFVLSWVFLTVSVLEIITLALLVFFQQNYFEIATDSRLYEMWLASRKKYHQKLSNFLGCEIERDIREDTYQNPLFSEVSNTHIQLFNMIFGLFLIASAIVMLNFMVLFGPLFWWIALMYGSILIVKSLSNDFSKRGGEYFYYNERNKIFKFNRNFGYKFQYMNVSKVESIMIRKWFRKLDFFDIFGLGGMLIMVVIQQIEGWSIADTLPLIYDNIISTIYMVVVLIFIILYVCLPIDVIEFRTPSIVYRIPITLGKINQSIGQKYFGNFRRFPREIFREDMVWTFIVRLITIVGLILGSVFYSIFTLITFFS